MRCSRAAKRTRMSNKSQTEEQRRTLQSLEEKIGGGVSLFESIFIKTEWKKGNLSLFYLLGIRTFNATRGFRESAQLQDAIVVALMLEAPPSFLRRNSENCGILTVLA